MQTQESPSTVSSNLLRLPQEVRILILRQLLLCTPYIDCFSRSRGLQVQILRVNKQLFSEGHEILYCENYFRMKIFGSEVEGTAFFATCQQFAEEIWYNLPQIKLIQHYDIYVEIRNTDDLFAIKPIIHKVPIVLSEIPRIKHLRITLGGLEEYCNLEEESENFYSYSSVLKRFTLLRGVHRVDFIGGIQPDYAENLKKIMEGNSPPDHLPKMFDALERLTRPFDQFQWQLEWARDGSEVDVDEFKQIRSSLTERIIEFIQNALNQLTDHDPEPDEEEEWVIEKRRRRKKQKR